MAVINRSGDRKRKLALKAVAYQQLQHRQAPRLGLRLRRRAYNSVTLRVSPRQHQGTCTKGWCLGKDDEQGASVRSRGPCT